MKVKLIQDFETLAVGSVLHDVVERDGHYHGTATDRCGSFKVKVPVACCAEYVELDFAAKPLGAPDLLLVGWIIELRTKIVAKEKAIRKADEKTGNHTLVSSELEQTKRELETALDNLVARRKVK
jgi:hypothetical protein